MMIAALRPMAKCAHAWRRIIIFDSLILMSDGCREREALFLWLNWPGAVEILADTLSYRLRWLMCSAVKCLIIKLDDIANFKIITRRRF